MKGIILIRCSGKRNIFFGKEKEWVSNFGVMFNKTAIEVAETKERLKVFEFFRNRPLSDA